MSEDSFAKHYHPQSFEEEIYRAWEQAGCFTVSPSDPRPAFTIVIPPPNVTGILHMGHALDNTLQDILIRYKRMDGFAALWIPGTDHAGIATQSVVERMLAKEGKTRKSLGREAFVKEIWQWKEKSGSTITHQLRRLGASCDWSRERFTLDPGLSQAVRRVFVSLYNEGLIYRSSYMVNWSPALESAISDLEVEYKDLAGKLYYFKYPVENEAQYIEVATTRPETILGDTAVAVHPSDPRYLSFHGKKLQHPLLARTLPVILDESVDPKFGTGAVKVTPAHDPSDYQMGIRHGLDMPNILTPNAHIDCKDSPYHGQDRFEARSHILADLSTKGLFVKEEPHTHAVGHCQRSGVIVEPRISTQWFVKVAPLAKAALEVVNQGEISFIPETWSKTYTHWMENIRDWCISRQLWWGHQIPVWYCQDCTTPSVCEDSLSQCLHCGSHNIQQDPDVLDTWFSSALWPFSTLGWPNKTADLEKFYPTSVLVTGFDIIFFWVARMIMMGLKCLNAVPFHQVHIHALIRDEQGKKMSKSSGNAVDPLAIIEKYGTDAFRFTLAAFAAQGRDILFAQKRIEGYRNFLTKLWNAARFVTQNQQGIKLDFTQAPKFAELSLPCQWILGRLDATTLSVRKGLDDFRFNDAAQALYHFIWHEYCDWFIELSKVDLAKDAETAQRTQHCLLYVLDQSLRLLHPLAPFITEKIWQELHHAAGIPLTGSLMLQSYPKPQNLTISNTATFELIQSCIEQVRIFRSENQIPPSRSISTLYLQGDAQSSHLNELIKHQHYIQKLAHINEIGLLQETATFSQPHSKLVLSQAAFHIILPWGELINLAEESARLNKELSKAEKDFEFLQQKLSNKDFTAKAPAEVLNKFQEKLSQTQTQVLKLRAHLNAIALFK